MPKVRPIKKLQDVELMKTVLKAKNIRDWALFVFGINSGLRVSDIIVLKVSDVRDDRGQIKNSLSLREQKTDKYKSFPINKAVKNTLKEYFDSCHAQQNDYLFPSQKGKGQLSRVQVYRILNSAADMAKIESPVGTHTMRKTMAYQAHRKGESLHTIQKMLNHASASETMEYIDLEQDDIDKAYSNLNL